MMSFNPSLVRPSSLRMASGAKHAASASGSRAFSDDMNRSMGFGKCIDIANKDGHVLTEWHEYRCSVCPLWVTSDVETRRHHVCFTPKATFAAHWRMSAKCRKRTFQETALYSPSTMNARDFVALIRMAVISFEF